MLPLITDAIDDLRAPWPASLPDPGAARLLRRPYFTLFPAALEDPATPTRLASHRFREARPTVRRHPLYGGPADDRPLVYADLRLGRAPVGLSPRASTAPPSTRSPRCRCACS